MIESLEMESLLVVLRTAGGFGAHQKVKWCAAKQQIVLSKSNSDGWGKDQCCLTQSALMVDQSISTLS